MFPSHPLENWVHSSFKILRSYLHHCCWNVKCSQYDNQNIDTSKTTHRSFIWSWNTSPGNSPKELKSSHYIATCINILKAGQYITAKPWISLDVYHWISKERFWYAQPDFLHSQHSGKLIQEVERLKLSPSNLIISENLWKKTKKWKCDSVLRSMFNSHHWK